jgi:hypothetical protein
MEMRIKKEEEEKRLKKELKKQNKEKEKMELVDETVSQMMGFGGFGSSKK